jgi:hypothetical protein
MDLSVQYPYAKDVLWSRNEKIFQLTFHFSFWATSTAHMADHADAYNARFIYFSIHEWAGSGPTIVVVDAAICAIARSGD